MTLSAVARVAGVSVSTVSRYVKGELQLKAATEKSIQEAMRQVGYRAVRPVQAVSRIALVLPEVSNPYFADIAEEVSRVAAEQSVETLTLLSGSSAGREQQILQSLEAQDDLSGVLYVGMNRENPALGPLAEKHPVVILDEHVLSGQGKQIPFVGADNFSGAFQATNYLAAQGHRRIGHIGGPEDLESARQRLRGYREGLARHGLEYDEGIVFRGPYSESFGAGVLTYVEQQDPPPTALVVSSDIVAVGILSAADRYNISIPGDLSLIGFDGIRVGAWLRPSLTTVVQPVRQIVESAFNAMRHIQEGGGAQDSILPMELRLRESTAALTRR